MASTRFTNWKSGRRTKQVWNPGFPEEGFPKMLTLAKDSAAFENTDWSEEQMNSVKLSYFENSSSYDKMLTTNYIIIDCYEASANAAILEAMRSKDAHLHEEFARVR